MDVLLSAVACNPNEGSEGGVGWGALLQIAKRHRVRVLTHRQSENDWIEAKDRIPANVTVRFLGSPEGWHSNRFVARLQSWHRFVKFNREVLAAAASWHRESPFDLAHQVTYATWRVPSTLWQLPVPFVWGPVGGAATIPKAFLGMLSPQARSLEMARNLQGGIASRSKAFRDCVTRAAVVLAANEETEDFLRPHRKGGPLLRLPVAYLSPAKVAQLERGTMDPVPGNGILKLFAGGNIEGRKGVNLALNALAKVRDAGVDFHYTVAGGGPEIPKLQALARELNLADRVTFHEGYRGDDYFKALKASDIYLLPSFRETTPVTLQEAILAGCYPVVADASAAGEMVRLAGGSAIAAETPGAMVQGLAAELIRLSASREEMRARAGEASRRIAGHYSATRYEETTEEAYRIALAAGAHGAA